MFQERCLEKSLFRIKVRIVYINRNVVNEKSSYNCINMENLVLGRRRGVVWCMKNKVDGVAETSVPASFHGGRYHL